MWNVHCLPRVVLSSSLALHWLHGQPGCPAQWPDAVHARTDTSPSPLPVHLQKMKRGGKGVKGMTLDLGSSCFQAPEVIGKFVHDPAAASSAPGSPAAGSVMPAYGPAADIFPLAVGWSLLVFNTRPHKERSSVRFWGRNPEDRRDEWHDASDYARAKVGAAAWPGLAWLMGSHGLR